MRPGQLRLLEGTVVKPYLIYNLNILNTEKFCEPIWLKACSERR
jgi:hypothetical protein